MIAIIIQAYEDLKYWGESYTRDEARYELGLDYLEYLTEEQIEEILTLFYGEE